MAALRADEQEAGGGPMLQASAPAPPHHARVANDVHDADPADGSTSSPGRVVTVAGYASLMDEASARATTPSLTNWRLATVRGYGRVFDLVSIVNIRKVWVAH